MASERQINVGGVPIGGGAPVAVQTMTKTETADLHATMQQIGRVAEAGADIVRVAVPREKDVDALKTIVEDSPIPVIADIHFNYTLALKALDAGAHCVRLNPGNIGGPDKVALVTKRANELGTPLRIGVNSGSLPAHLRELEFENPVEALVTAAVEFVALMERLEFTNFKVSMKSTSVPNTIASNRLLSERIPYPLHLGITEAGTKWSGSLKSAVGLGTLLADGIGDTIRISLSTFHAEEEVKVAWEILKALKLRERGPVLIACPTCGRLQFDMDSVVAEVERRLEQYEDPIEVSVLGCAVNGIGEARELKAMDPNLALYEVISLQEQVDRSTSAQKVAVTLTGTLGGLALVLAAIGLYGVMSYTVSQSTRELGLRMALGAKSSGLFRLVISRGLALTFVGIFLGAALALGLTRLLGYLLYKVSPYDPVAFSYAFLVLTIVSLIACFLPAWRATRVDPIVALRYE